MIGIIGVLEANLQLLIGIMINIGGETVPRNSEEAGGSDHVNWILGRIRLLMGKYADNKKKIYL